MEMAKFGNFTAPKLQLRNREFVDLHVHLSGNVGYFECEDGDSSFDVDNYPAVTYYDVEHLLAYV
jgi:hypothetical protein